MAVLGLKAQEKFSMGVQIEGFHSNPKNLSDISTMEGSFGVGAGMYVSHIFWKSFSANTGLNYRFVQYDQFDKNIGYPPNSERPFDGYRYNQNSLVIPLNIRKSFFTERLFVEAGLELDRVLNHENKDPKIELLWKIGAGSRIGKLNYSLNYIWGNKEQADVLISDSNYKVITYKSRMLQLKVSYPLLQMNK